MKWMEKVKELDLIEEEQFIELLKRTPADPLLYVIKVQDKIKVSPYDYYSILALKYESENNKRLLLLVNRYRQIFKTSRVQS